MALQFKGGRATVIGEDRKRLNWLMNREARLKDQLRTGEIELAAQTISDILGSAKPGDIDPTKAERMQNAIRNAINALNDARAGYVGNIVKG